MRTLEIEEQRDGARSRLTLRGEIDLGTLPRLENAIEAALAGSPEELIVDLRPLSFLDSSGLRQFIVLAERAERQGWRLLLVRPGMPALSVFRVTRAEENLPFVDDLAG